MEITKQTAKRLYNEAPEWFKEQLTEQFGADSFREEKYMQVKTFEDACKILGVDPKEVFHKNDLPDEIAYKKIKVITKAINEGWKPNWNDTAQSKWFPVFNLSSGFGFSASRYGLWLSDTRCGSRLCFESEEKANYAGTQFIDLYKDLLTISE